uniref:KH RNA binding domain containing, signal transduction associated 2 n=1 Tax=Equus caballus TaxID=9796 RepID=A0A9L0S9W4_HORSE
MEEEKYLPELMAEKDSLDPSFVHASRLLAEEIEKFQGSDGKKEDEEKKYLDVISNKNIKLSERVLIPVKQYPKVVSHLLSTGKLITTSKVSLKCKCLFMESKPVSLLKGPVGATKAYPSRPSL